MKNRVKNVCARCAVDLGLDELEARECGSCGADVNIDEMQNVEIDCADCGQTQNLRVDVSNPKYDELKSFYFCEDCVSCASDYDSMFD